MVAEAAPAPHQPTLVVMVEPVVATEAVAVAAVLRQTPRVQVALALLG